MNKLLEYIKERSSMCGCNPNKWECDKYLECDACMKDKIAEHDAKVRADAIDEAIDKCKDLVRDVMVDLDCVNATKYGNKNAKQQENSYSTIMRYEIADELDSLLDLMEQLKEQKAED